jgi:hypothetical protein
MSKHKTGLHKDVSVIFDGVWNPEADNFQQTFREPVASSDAYVQPGSSVVVNYPKEARLANAVKGIVKAPGYLFSSRSRREKKRLLSISKHLLINMPS